MYRGVVLVCVLCVLVRGQDRALDIRVPPTITEQSTDLERILQEGRDTEITCQASGHPSPDYEWKFNGDEIDLNKGNVEVFDTYIKVTLGPFQEGAYQCFAQNAHGKTMTDITYLKRAVLAGFPPNIPDKVYNKQAGESVVVECTSTKSVPQPTYAWRTVVDREDKSPVDINTDRRVQLDDKGNLYFSYIKKSDEQNDRLYMCSLTNLAFGGSMFGSFSKVIVSGSNNDADLPNKPPSNMFFTGKDETNTIIAIRGEDLQLRCLFSGKPVPDVSWTKEAGTLPGGRVDYESYNTVLMISAVRDSDEGVYICTGSNAAGTDSKRINVKVESKPVFLDAKDEPSNLNVTQGQDAVFRCAAESVPPPTVEWYMNGDLLTIANKPVRVTFEDNDRVLRVRQACKECAAGPSDLKVYQCNTSNVHGYQFKAAYLNVLVPTTLDVAPLDLELVYKQDVLFECKGSSDDSTPITITWFKDGQQIQYIPGEIEAQEGNTILKIITEDLEESGLEYVGDYTCVISNGYSKVNATASLTRPPIAPPVIQGGIGDLWWVFLIIGILLLLLLLLLICCLCCQRNRGDSYPVDEKERQNGNDPEKELADSGFHDYQRPEDEPVKGSRASLSSAMKLDDSDDDASLAEYGDIDTGRFNEDGSFIGQYNTADRRRGNESNV